MPMKKRFGANVKGANAIGLRTENGGIAIIAMRAFSGAVSF